MLTMRQCRSLDNHNYESLTLEEIDDLMDETVERFGHRRITYSTFKMILTALDDARRKKLKTSAEAYKRAMSII